MRFELIEYERSSCSGKNFVEGRQVVVIEKDLRWRLVGDTTSLLATNTRKNGREGVGEVRELVGAEVERREARARRDPGDVGEFVVGEDGGRARGEVVGRGEDGGRRAERRTGLRRQWR